MNKKQEQLETMRHSAAHLMAAAVQELYPAAKFGIGPVIENGFYYDFDLPAVLIPDDFKKIEKKMKELQRKNLSYERQEMKLAEAINFFKKIGQDYKVELLNDL
ncbi:MAG TPA: threonine--tRNA ligase, partial [Patescibacteria group bacterium]